MKEDEVEIVAEELAKVGGLSWYPGRPDGAFLRAVSDRYRQHARVIIETLDKLRASKTTQSTSQTPNTMMPPTSEALPSLPNRGLQIGSVVRYRPPRDRRSILCRIEKLEEGQAFLVPFSTVEIGWVALDALVPSPAGSPAEEV